MSRSMKRPARAPESPEQVAKRRERNERARARHWRRTGVSEDTVRWMRRGGWL